MDIDAIARKWLEQRGVDLAMEGPATVRCIMDGAKMTIEGVLAAAGVPEMEKRLQAAEKVCEVAKRDHVFCTAECASCEVGSCAESDLRDALREWERKEATP